VPSLLLEMQHLQFSAASFALAIGGHNVRLENKWIPVIARGHGGSE
jgi:hypothetical protein